MISRDAAVALVDSLTDEGITKLVSELLWYQVTTRSESAAPSATALMRDLRRMMAEKARGHLIDRLVTP